MLRETQVRWRRARRSPAWRRPALFPHRRTQFSPKLTEPGIGLTLRNLRSFMPWWRRTTQRSSRAIKRLKKSRNSPDEIKDRREILNADIEHGATKTIDH